MTYGQPQRIYAYAIRTKDYAVRFKTNQPDYSFLPEQNFNWTYSVCDNVHEILPDDMPEQLGKAVITTTNRICLEGQNPLCLVVT